MSISEEKITEAIDLIGLAEALIAPERENVSLQQLNAGLRVMLRNVRELLQSVHCEDMTIEKAPPVRIERKSTDVSDDNTVPVAKNDVAILEIDEDLFNAQSNTLTTSSADRLVDKSSMQSALEIITQPVQKKDSPLIARKAVQVSSTKLGGKIW